MNFNDEGAGNKKPRKKQSRTKGENQTNPSVKIDWIKKNRGIEGGVIKGGFLEL